jgi:transposase
MWCVVSQIIMPRLTEEKKWNIVVLHKKGLLSQRQIAKRVNCHPTTVAHVINTYKDTGTVHERERSGRPSLLHPHLLKTLDSIIGKHNTAPSHELHDLLLKKTGRRISPRTIRRARRGPLARRPVHERFTQTLTQGHITKRLAMARFLLNTNLHNIRWSDEWSVQLTRTGQLHWLKRGEHAPTREVRDLKARVMVWGCVWYNGKSELCVTDRTIDAKYYIEILRDYMLPCLPNSDRYYFQHDNASPHTAETVTNWLAENDVKVLQDWPPYSPELNPIESVWSYMKAYVCKEAPRTKAELVNAVERAWDSLTVDDIRPHIENLPKICQQIIAAEGEHI